MVDVLDLRAVFELAAAGKAAEALERCQSLIDTAEVANTAPYLFAMGLIAYYNGDEGLGLKLSERAHLIDPKCRNYVDALANMHTRLGHLADGLYYAKLAMVSDPDPIFEGLVPQEMASYRTSLDVVGVSQHNMNAHTDFQLGKFEEAIGQAEQELRINPYSIDTMDVLARAQLAMGLADRATAIMLAAIHITPTSSDLHARLAEALVAAGRHDDALPHQHLALALGDDSNDDDNDARIATVAGAALYQSDSNWLTTRKYVERFASQWENGSRATPVNDDGGGMIGILWDQCHEGPLMEFIQPILAALSNTILYNTTIRRDLATEQLRSSVLRPRNSVDVDRGTLGRIMLGDGLACLINLCSARPSSTFPTFKGSNCPITVHWLNLPMMDRLPGATLVISGPETQDLDERNYGSGNMVRLSRLLAYEFPKSFAPEEAIYDPPRDVLGHVTFGLTGDPSRLTTDTILAVARTLWACRDSRLMIGGRANWESGLIERLTNAFARFGLASRIEFQQAVDVAGDPASIFYQQIDVLLDSTPVNGHREVVRALWMGIPVISLRGQRRAGRLGASILHAAGLSEWTAGSVEEYAAIATKIGLSSDLPTLRAKLRDRVTNSPLADTSGMAQELAKGLGDWLRKNSAQALQA